MEEKDLNEWDKEQLRAAKETICLFNKIIELKNEIKVLKNGKVSLRYTNKQLLEENEKFRTVLTFYADIENYDDDYKYVARVAKEALKTNITEIVHKDGTVEKVEEGK